MTPGRAREVFGPALVSRPMAPPSVMLLVDRDGTHVAVVDAEGRTLFREGVGSPTTTMERQHRMTCTALLTPEGTEQLARVLLTAAQRAR